LIQSTGRRKAAVARVRIRLGTGAVTVNSRPIDDYFPSATHRMIITEPLRLVEKDEAYDIDATMGGGGVSGQAGALRLGIARALAELDPELRVPLKRAGFLTRDAREKESKKYGLKKARKAPQYSKR
jgi:small subunit ribosomal protein S9